MQPKHLDFCHSRHFCFPHMFPINTHVIGDLHIEHHNHVLKAAFKKQSREKLLFISASVLVSLIRNISSTFQGTRNDRQSKETSGVTGEGD